MTPPSAAPYQLLSPYPEQALAFTTAIERVARLIGRARTGMSSLFDITVPGWRMLSLVELSGSIATLTHLARHLHLSRPSARETATRLRDIGYLAIGRSPGDRRLCVLTVTDAGMECLSELDAGIKFLMLEMTSDIPVADLVQATQNLDRMAQRLRPCETVFRRSPRRPAPG